MATQATAQATAAAQATVEWEVEVLGACARCGGEMTIAPHVMGIELGPNTYLCDPCFFVFDGSKAAARAALGPSGDDDGGEDPDGCPAAPALAPVDLAIAAARSARPFTHLAELSDAERAEYEAWAEEVAAETPDPEPCARCGRPASPFEETPDGPLCFRCWDPAPGTPDRHRPDLTDVAALWVDVLTDLTEAKAQLARLDARLAAIRAR
jgi:hypothetical protein